MLNISKMMFLSTMILGTMVVISSETWLGIWMGLEMNMISFVPLLFISKKSDSAESCMIYFLTQSIGSIILLMLVLSNSLLMKFPYEIDELISVMMMFSIMIKLGVPPFHFWFPEIIEKMSWGDCVILMTWQKIAPLVTFSHIMVNYQLFPVIIAMAVIVGAVGGLNQTSIRKIMAYSSISHLGWMIACMKFNNMFWVIYLATYSFMIILMTWMFYMYSMFFINQISFNSSSFMEKIMISTLFLSLGGLPPFLGFFPKWMVIQTMMMSENYITLIIMIISSLITLFYYIRMISSSLLINSTSWKWKTYMNMNSNLSTLIIILNMSLPVIVTFSI